MKFYISLPDPELARGEIAAFSFSAQSVQGLAGQLQNALSNPAYCQSWLASLDAETAEGIDPQLLAVDPQAKVSGAQHDLSFSLLAVTSLNGTAFKHRMRLLAGNHWQLTDVK